MGAEEPRPPRNQDALAAVIKPAHAVIASQMPVLGTAHSVRTRHERPNTALVALAKKKRYPSADADFCLAR
jgi:hypothetical protein